MKNVTVMVAYVKHENTPSRHVFLKNGFLEYKNDSGDRIVYSYRKICKCS